MAQATLPPPLSVATDLVKRSKGANNEVRSQGSSCLRLILSASLALTACGGGATAGGAAAGTGATSLTLGTIQDVRSWDPAQAHVGHILQPYQAVYDSLVASEPDGKLRAMLATAWKYNAANTKLTVDLRSDVTFSDGAKFDAEAAKANMVQLQEGQRPAKMAQLNAVKDVAVVDADTIDINLSRRTRPWNTSSARPPS